MASIEGGGRLGVQRDMASTCEDLGTKANSIQGYIDELETLKNQLPNDWEGEDLDMLMAEFEGFKEKLSEMPLVIKSISDWGNSTYEAYMGHAAQAADWLSQILA